MFLHNFPFLLGQQFESMGTLQSKTYVRENQRTPYWRDQLNVDDWKKLDIKVLITNHQSCVTTILSTFPTVSRLKVLIMREKGVQVGPKLQAQVLHHPQFIERRSRFTDE